MKKVYKKPELYRVELKSDEEVLVSCGKCPGNAANPQKCNQAGLPTKQS